MDKILTTDPMQNSSQIPLGGLDPANLLKQGAAEDTFMDGAASCFNPPPIEELVAIFPQFEILGLIGQGGMGAVYKVRQKDLDRIVALKILPPASGQSPEFAARFTREAKALGKLNHPGIVTLHEFGQRDGLYFILMEFVDGVNLAQLMKSGRISPREALAIIPQICEALQFAHDQGIVHRDIKPENLLLDRLGRVKIADFGIAKVVAAVCDHPAEQERNPRRSEIDATLAGKILGTPHYMAPEQFSHPAEVDHRADIYALGVVFYQMLTGELPGKYLEAPSKRVHIDVRLDEIVLKAMEKDPELRFQQVSVMQTRVESFAENSTLLETPQPDIANIQTAFNRFSSDHGNWYFYIIYFNREDPRIIVPKRMVGWTINFAQPLAIPVLAAMILTTLGLLEVALRLGATGPVMLGVKLAILIALIWFCHSMSSAQPKAAPPLLPVRKRGRVIGLFCGAALMALAGWGYVMRMRFDVRGESPLTKAGIASPGAIGYGSSPKEVTKSAEPNVDKYLAETRAESYVELALETTAAREAYLTGDPARVTAEKQLDAFLAKNPEFPNEESRQICAGKQVVLLAEINHLAAKFGTRHPRIVELNRTMETLAKLPEIGEKQLETEAAEKIISRQLPPGNRLEIRRVLPEDTGVEMIKIHYGFGDSQEIRVSSEVIVCDKHIMKISYTQEGETGNIDITLNEVGAKRLGEATKTDFGTLRLAIMIGGKVESAPVVNNQLGRKFQISGKSFKDYADFLRSLPIWDAQKNSLEAATWLVGIDEGKYAERHAAASTNLRERFPEPTWDAMLAHFRKPMGFVTSRGLTRYTELKTVDGSDYRLIVFETHFSNQRGSVETVAFMKEKDGSWKAVGYFIR